ncbi:MAG: hypothetical protein QOI64_159 [Solirubrobacteraceae bacterium]|jgi:hypothetical protein|nr:hypothetical protein [Solirubrobacteraceae bacterium]
MTTSPPPRGRRRAALAGATAAAVAAAVLAATGTFGSSHREAPLTSLDPATDDTDLYAYTAADAPGSLTVVANWIPFQDPGGGPNFYKFDTRARYYINVDNTGDGAYDVRYQFKFRTLAPNSAAAGYPVALPPIASLDDPKLERQRMTVTRERYVNGRQVSAKVIGANLPVAPSNLGPKTMPGYEALANQAIRPLRLGGRVFAGQRDDPFYIPLDRAFDTINLAGAGTGNIGGGIDTLAGYGVSSVVLQIPESQVTRDAKRVAGASASNAVVGVWASAERRRLQVVNDDRGLDLREKRSPWVQVSRLGNPLINELVIPLALKDKFNRTQPKDDLANFGRYALAPFPAAALNQLFDLGIKETGRTDIVQALLTGVPGLTQIGTKPAPADTLKINLGVAPAATENRFGVIGGDTAGFPNGRRLGDDVVDITLRVVGGYLVPEAQGGKKLPLGDGVDRNDQDFLATFPYVPSLKNEIGGSPTEDRQEPVHPPTPGEDPS